jgi:thiamine pyrophosphate-dependent acetolactate synthase large subunit-like protein
MSATHDDGSNPRIYEALARAFREEGVEVLFALLGDGNMHWATALTALGVRGIYARHEHCACAMATVYTNATGRIGVASVTCGPGLTQTMTQLAIGVRARIPFVMFAGESPYNVGFYNQHIEQGPLVRATGAHYIAAHSPQRITDYVRDAFLIAKTERLPVVLGVPLDLQQQALPKPFAYTPSDAFIPRLAPMAPAPADVAAAVELIGRSPKVVVLAGRGALKSGAQLECERLADLCDGVLATTLPMRGLFDHHPFSVGISGGYARLAARQILKEADLVVAVGAGLLTPYTTDSGRLFAPGKILQIDTAPVGMKDGRQIAATAVRADAKAALTAIIAALPQGRTISGWRSPALADRLADLTVDDARFDPQPGLLDPRDAVAAIDRCVPKEWDVVNSSGHCAFFTAQLRNRRPENFNVIREFGAIGNGLSYAIGVAAAKPDRTVVLLDGDGSLMMHAQELETLHRHGLRVLVCVLNDGAYGSEIHKMQADGISQEGGRHGRGDLAAVARGFGLQGCRITHVDQFAPALDAFQSGKGAMLWDIHIADNVTTPLMRSNVGH